MNVLMLSLMVDVFVQTLVCIDFHLYVDLTTVTMNSSYDFPVYTRESSTVCSSVIRN